MTLAISCRGLKKHYGDVRAVDGLDLEVRSGECFGLLGPNGAGKTTTIEILEGLTEPDAGDVTILGRRWGSQERELRERLGVSLQETRLTEKLTVYETLRSLPLVLRARPRARGAHGRPLARGEARRARGKALRRTAPAAGRRLCARRGSGAPLPRRADDRPRSAEPPPALGAHRGVQGRRPDRAPHHALHGGGREAVRPRRGRGPRARSSRRAPRPSSSPACGPRTSSSSRPTPRSPTPCSPRSPGSASAGGATERWFLAAASLADAVPALLGGARRRGREARLPLDAPRHPRGRLHRPDGTGAAR